MKHERIAAKKKKKSKNLRHAEAAGCDLNSNNPRDKKQSGEREG